MEQDILGRFKLNHVSATGTAAGALPFTWIPRDYADYLNPKVCEKLVYEPETVSTGITIFDFVDSYIADRVYTRNFPKYAKKID